MTDPSAGADLRALLPPVRDQGQRGTCVAFAVTAAHEMARASGDSVEEDLSAEALNWGCKLIDGNWNSGTRLTSAENALAATGQPLETVWPYDPRRATGVAYSPPTRPGAGWHKAQIGQATHNLTTVRAELGAGNPVVLALVVFDSLFTPTVEGWIESPPAGSPTRGRHAVLAVGYNTEALLIRNSWGPTWGIGGYAWLVDDYAEHHIREVWVMQSRTISAPRGGAQTTGDIYGSR